MGVEPTVFELDGRRVRDLNGNGRLDPYEDPRRPVEERVDDLLAQMTLAEKAGLMFQPPIGVGPDGELLEGPSAFGGEGTTRLVVDRHLNHFNIYATPDAAPAGRVAQQAAAARRDDAARHPGDDLIRPAPRLRREPVRRAGRPARSRSGPSRSGSPRRATRSSFSGFGDIARQEYRAVGIRVALHPMADLATEPRWARISGTFGEDAELVGAPDGGLHPRLPGRRARPDQRRLHDQALPRRRPAGRRRGPALPVRQGAGLSRRAASTTT